MSGLTLTEAEAILSAAKAKAVENGFIGSVSVVDARGDLIAMFRLDGGPWRSPYISRGKAVASACFGAPTGALEERAQRPVMRGMMAIEGGHMIPGKGALPIFRNGELIGAAGGSGGTAEQDEDCCRAGIEAAGLSVTR